MIKRLLLGIITIGLFSFQCQAEDAQWKDSAPETYTVKKGDTLWGISGQYLTNPWKWPDIWKANPQVSNPNLIYPGDVLNVVTVDGKKMLSVDHGDKKLSPSIHSTELEEAIPAIPLNVIAPFLTGSRIVSSEILEAAPYVISTGQGQIVAGAGDLVFARGSFDKETAAFGFFRKEKPFIDPQTKEFLGVQAEGVGVGKVKSVEGDVATLAVITTSQEVRLADRLLVSETRSQQSIFYPMPPAGDISGAILSVEGGVDQVGVMNVVVISRGARDSLEAGQVLAIYQSGAVVRDPVTNTAVKIPDQRAGLLMVFNVFEKASYALVLQADRPLRVGDLVKQP